jgi:heme exporter protein A
MLVDDPSPDTSQHVAPRPASLPPLLVADGLVRRFGPRAAVDGVSLTLPPGACLALFGPNGAGKTTLLRMLGGLLKPTRGEVMLDGHRLPGDGGVRRLIGLISHHTMLYAPLTARENVRFAAECQGIVGADAAATAALARLRVLDREHAPVRALSRGLQQRVSIARALVHRPRLLLLDEPYTGLDDVGARALTDALRELKADGAALILVTHHLGEGLALASDAAIMLQGKIVATDRADDVPDADGLASTAYANAYAERYRDLVMASIG